MSNRHRLAMIPLALILCVASCPEACQDDPTAPVVFGECFDWEVTDPRGESARGTAEVCSADPDSKFPDTDAARATFQARVDAVLNAARDQELGRRTYLGLNLHQVRIVMVRPDEELIRGNGWHLDRGNGDGFAGSTLYCNDSLGFQKALAALWSVSIP